MAQGLFFDIDASEIEKLIEGFELSKDQLRAAYTRALQRTAQRMRTAASRGLRARMGLRNASRLRSRLKVRRFRGGGQGKDATEIELWAGLNDFLMSDFKGAPRKVADGVEFRGRKFDGAFFASIGGKRQVVRRSTLQRLPIEVLTVPVADEIQVFLEDEIFEMAADVFWDEFVRDVRARALFGVGQAK